MAITLQNLFDLGIGLTEFTDCRFFERLGLDDKERAHLAVMLTLAMPLGLRLWYSEKTMQLIVSSGDTLVSDGIPLSSASALSSAVVMMEFMQGYLKLPDDRKVSNVENRIAELEKRVAALEISRDGRDDTLTEMGVKTVAEAYQEEMAYNHYLELFRKRESEFKELGIDFVIDTEKRQVRYKNGDLRLRCYDISQLGYRKANDALHKLKKRNRKND